MKHFDELSQALATKVQKACRKHPDATLDAVVADQEVLQAIQNLIYHYKLMTNDKPISTRTTVSEPLPEVSAAEGVQHKETKTTVN